MNALQTKEFRLLLPSWGAALVLAAASGLLMETELSSRPFAIALLLFGALLLALTTFGAEFSFQTFSLVLSQPLQRARIWRTKIAALVFAMVTTLLLWGLVVYWKVDPTAHTFWREIVPVGAMGAAVVFTGGLWSTLLLRQMVGAFWLSVLVPGLIFPMLELTHAGERTVYLVLGLYVVAGFVWARQLFFRAQETGWTGGEVSLPSWRGAGARARAELRVRRPFAALLWKEFQLQKIALIGIAWLFVAHLGVLWLRRTSEAPVETVLEMFGGIWILVPLITGSLSVAEERKLGVWQSHLCLPFSHRIQFLLKLAVVVLLGGLLSALLLWTAESIGLLIGSGPGVIGTKTAFELQDLGDLCLLFILVALAGFYGSTATRGIVPALACAIACVVTLIVLLVMSAPLGNLGGANLWRGPLILWVFWPVIILTGIFLAFQNFQTVADTGRMWRSNLVGWAAAVCSIVLITPAIHHRFWELLMPLEPSPGPAQIAGQDVVLRAYFDRLALRLPDGRVFLRQSVSSPDTPNFPFAAWKNSSTAFISGSNWMAAAPGERETVCLRSDGTLWQVAWPGVPKQPFAAPQQVGGESNWLQGTRHPLFLLKRNGTLWRWNSGNPQFPDLLPAQPRQWGTNTDWTALTQGANQRCIFWNRQGEAYEWPASDRQQEQKTEASLDALERTPLFDGVIWKSYTDFVIYNPEFIEVRYHFGVRPDGTLWGAQTLRSLNKPVPDLRAGLMQLGKDTNWVSVSGDYWSLSGLKADGTLWRWKVKPARWGDKVRSIDLLPVSQLGSRTDWVAAAETMDGTISLAADGNLWFWWAPEMALSRQKILRLSRKPLWIGNIFSHPSGSNVGALARTYR